MENSRSDLSFFSVSPGLVVTDKPIPYDLFINSSSLASRERFVRIFRKSGVLTAQDVQLFIAKYRSIYVVETERGKFLQSLSKLEQVTPVEKTAIIKDTAIQHLQTLFDHEVTTEVLGRVITDCRDVVEGMIDVVGDYRVDQLQDLIGNLSFHDFYTYDHSINVSMYCILIYRALKPDASREEIVQAGLGGLLHDLGKIKIPTEILNFSGKLSDEQFAEIKKHPGFGSELLEQVKGSLPANIASDLVGRVILEHHENFDGTGYPNRLAGEQIHLLSRVTAIADFFDAITTKRAYHDPLSLDEALSLMGNAGGKKIDPKLFRFFVEHTQQMNIQGHLKMELAADFDPCQPCRALPLISHIHVEGEDDLARGKVKFVEEPQRKKSSDAAKLHKPRKKAG